MRQFLLFWIFVLNAIMVLTTLTSLHARIAYATQMGCEDSAIASFDYIDCVNGTTSVQMRWLCDACHKVSTAQCTACETDPDSIECDLCDRISGSRRRDATRLMILGCHTFCSYGDECELPVCGEGKCPASAPGAALAHEDHNDALPLGEFPGPASEIVDECTDALCDACLAMTQPV